MASLKKDSTAPSAHERDSQNFPSNRTVRVLLVAFTTVASPLIP